MLAALWDDCSAALRVDRSVAHLELSLAANLVDQTVALTVA